MAAPAGKKRKAREDEDLSFVELPRDQLLTMSSTQLEDNIMSLTAIRSLTGAEQREIKRQRRLVKNREYAQTSRVKKKQFVEELRQENDLLKDRLRTLEEENHYLRFGGPPAPQQFARQPMNLEQLVAANLLPPNRNFISTYLAPQQNNSYHQQDSYQNQQMNYSTHCSSSVPASCDTPHSSPEPPGHYTIEPQHYPNEQQYSNEQCYSTDIPSNLPLNSTSSSTEHSSEEVDVFDEFLFLPLEETPQQSQFGSPFAGSLCLMVILFSFALLLPNFLTQATPLVAQNGIAFADQSFESFRTSRSLLSISEVLAENKLFQPGDSLYTPISLSGVLEDESSYVLYEKPISALCSFPIPVCV